MKATLNILNDPETKKNIIAWTLPNLTQHLYFQERIINIVKEAIQDFAQNADNADYISSEWELGFAVDYLEKCGNLSETKEYLEQIFLDDRFDKDTRSYALRRFLRIDPHTSFEFLIENYSSQIMEKVSEILLCKELVASNWSGALVTKIITTIKETGSDRAKEVLEESSLRRDREVIKTKEIENRIFSNSKIVSEIYTLRMNINTRSQIKFGFAILPSNEMFISQLQPPRTKESLVNTCVNLRSLLSDFSSKIDTNGLSEVEIEKLLPGVNDKDKKGSLNRLYVFLKSKDLEVEIDLWGLRPLNRLVNLIAHPKESTELIKELNKLDLTEKYKRGEWFALHEKLLTLYKEFLEKIINCIE